MIFALLYVCGLRRSEVVSLDLSDYDTETLEVRVRGKGNKERMVYAEGGDDRAGMASDIFLSPRVAPCGIS